LYVLQSSPSPSPPPPPLLLIILFIPSLDHHHTYISLYAYNLPQINRYVCYCYNIDINIGKTSYSMRKIFLFCKLFEKYVLVLMPLQIIYIYTYVWKEKIQIQ
jgi:hypothetical protein